MSNKDFDDIYSSTEPKSNDNQTENDAFYVGSSSRDIYSSTTKSKISDKEYKAFRKKRITVNVVLSIILAVSIVLTTLFGTIQYVMGGMMFSDITNNSSELGIDNTLKLDENVYNIALFGVDSRKANSTSGLSDTIIVVSVNVKDNTVKMTSILRDSYVPIEGAGEKKINTAYSKGGPVLAIKTLNQNFKLNITDYATVNMRMLEKVINVLGGVDIHITEKERVALNTLATAEGFNVKKVDKSEVGKDGLVHLDGGQAMMYARIRKIDSDNVRALRQQKVLTCLFAKMKEKSLAEYPNILREILSNVETSLTYSEILSLASSLNITQLSLQSTTVPGDEVSAKGGIYGKAGWVWRYDINEAATYIHEWIYGKEK